MILSHVPHYRLEISDIDFPLDEQCTYSPLQCLTSSTVSAGNPPGLNTTDTTRVSCVYDYLGNRQQTVNGQVTTYSFNQANNELSLATGPSGTVPSWYDADGNLVAKNATATSRWTYNWNVLGNLLYVANNSGTQGWYEYDGLGRRVESREASTTQYAYMGTETLYELSSGSGADYVYADGFRIARVTSQTVNYYHQDALGSVRLVTDSTSKASVVFSDNYQPYGQDNGAPGGGGSNSYRYTDRSWSSTTSLYYDNQRWYDPGIGRFISQDPLPGYKANPQSLNPYVYVVNQPTRLTDPSGAGFLWQGCGAGERCGSLGASYTAPTINVQNFPGIEYEIRPVAESLSSTEVAEASWTGASTLASDLVSQDEQTNTRVPNPYGRNGGLQHQAGMGRAIDEIKSLDLTPRTEFRVRGTVDGRVITRFVDVAGLEENDNPVVFYQVGRYTNAEMPVSREINAIYDVQSITGVDVRFIPYNFG